MDPKTLLLDHYHCTFFLPLIGLHESGFLPKYDVHQYSTESLKESRTSATEAIIKTDDLLEALKEAEHKSKNFNFKNQKQEAEAQAYRFFSPQLRNIIFNLEGESQQTLKPVKEWHLSPETVDLWELHLGGGEGRGEFQISENTIHLSGFVPIF